MVFVSDEVEFEVLFELFVLDGVFLSFDVFAVVFEDGAVGGRGDGGPLVLLAVELFLSGFQ